MALLGLHPCQRFNLEELPNWSECQFNDGGTGPNEEAVNDIEGAFREALQSHSLLRFVKVYIARGRGILERSGRDPFVYAILGEGLSRMVGYFFVFIRHHRDSLSASGSAVTWQIEPSLLQRARAIADEVEKSGKEVSPYYKLSEDPPLDLWVRKNVRPVIESYVGSRAVAPHAHIRTVSAARFGPDWQHLYAANPNGYFHWDESCYSMPLIVYLDDVHLQDGPYSVVEGSDKWPRNFTIRAFTQAISCKLLVTNHFDAEYKQKIAALPRVFRGGEMVGAHLARAVLDEQPIRTMTGPAGTAVLSDGFSVVHAGGHPTTGRRRALFIAHRYPRKKLVDVYSRLGGLWWKLRVPPEKPRFAVNGASRRAM